MPSTLVLAILICCLQISHENVPDKRRRDKQWAKFKADYCRDYANADEERQKRRIFDDTMDYVDEHNAGDYTYTLGINQFTDWTLDEFAEGMLGTLPPRPKICSTQQNSEICPKIDRDMKVPETFDWTIGGTCNSSVKHQNKKNKCNSCWAFSTIGAFEGHRCRKYGEVIDLSVQQLLYNYHPKGEVNPKVCDKGNLPDAYEMIQYHDIATETDCPYVGNITRSKVKDKCDFGKHQSVCSGIKTIECTNFTHAEILMKQILFAKGPLSVSFDSKHIEAKQYKAGVINKVRNCNWKEPNHGVIIVGYGTDTKSKMPYWHIKNSMGTDSGMEGYFRMRRGVNLCGIENWAYYPELYDCCKLN